jgi:hypothetical protein
MTCSVFAKCSQGERWLKGVVGVVGQGIKSLSLLYDGLSIPQVWATAIPILPTFINPSEFLNSRHYNSTRGRMLIRPQTPVHHLSMHLPPLSSTIPRYVIIMICKASRHNRGYFSRGFILARRRSVWPSCIRKHLFSYRQPNSGTSMPVWPVANFRMLIENFTLRTSLKSALLHLKVA